MQSPRPPTIPGDLSLASLRVAKQAILDNGVGAIVPVTQSDVQLETNGGGITLLQPPTNSSVPLYSRKKCYPIITGNFPAYIGSSAVDSQNNVYVCMANDTGNILPVYNRNGTSTVFVTPGNAYQNAFILKYNSEGIVLSMTLLNNGGYGSAMPQLAIDSEDNLYAIGMVSNGQTPFVYNFSTDGIYVTAFLPNFTPSSESVFVYKWNSAGTALSWTVMGDIGPGYLIFPTIAIDKLDNVYAVFSYLSTPVINVYNLSTTNSLGTTAPFTLPTSPTICSLAVVKFVGDVATSYTVLNCGTRNNTSNLCASVVFDSQNNLIIGTTVVNESGYQINNFSNGALSPSAYSVPSTTSNPYSVLIKWNAEGLVQQWTLNIGNTGSFQITSMSIDSLDNLYVCGLYTTTGSLVINNLSSSTSLVPSSIALPISTISGYIIKFLTSGVAYSWTILPVYDYGFGIMCACDSQNNLYLYAASHFQTTIPVYNFSTTTAIGTLQFGAPILPGNDIDSRCLLIKWGPNGIPYSWTNLDIDPTGGTFVGLAMSIDNDDSVYFLVGAQINMSFPYSIGNMTSSDVPSNQVVFYNKGSNPCILVKILSNGQVSIMPEITYALPEVMVPTEFVVNLQTPNYNYNFIDPVTQNIININQFAGSLKTLYTFLWYDGEWQLVA